MTTELYFQLEIRERARRRWGHFARVRLSEDYVLYALLAGVRAADLQHVHVECLSPKGLPDDVTERSLEEDAYTVDDEAAKLEIRGACTLADAEEWVRQGLSRFLHDQDNVTRPDYHSHSWLSLSELQLVLSRYVEAGGKGALTLQSVLAMMETFQLAGIDSRAVFWFEG